MVEALWPLPLPQYSVKQLRRWDRAELEARFTGDLLQDNLILNKWEFANGRTVLESFPWRLSVPFVLCNAQCDFCAAWLMQGKSSLDELMTSLIPVIRHCYQLDLVGWGEPLIHPQFADSGYLDTAMVQLRFDNGAFATAEASFQAAYGYDVRGEIFGSHGLLLAGREPRNAAQQNTELFADAYVAQFAHFVDSVLAGSTPSVTGHDARVALEIALAAAESVRTDAPVTLSRALQR